MRNPFWNYKLDSKKNPHKSPLFYGYASFLMARGSKTWKKSDCLKVWSCYWEDLSERKKMVREKTIWFCIMKHEWALNFLSCVPSAKAGIQTNLNKSCWFQLIPIASTLTKASMFCSFSEPGRDPSRPSENAERVQKFTRCLHFNTFCSSNVSSPSLYHVTYTAIQR